jgi:hypothetical protein
MNPSRLFRDAAKIISLVCLATLLVSAARMPVRSFFIPDNVRLDANPAQRIRSLWILSGQALNDLEVRFEDESDEDYLRRYTNTRRLMLNIAWFESVQLQHRRQIRGPARSFYQIEPIRAMSCCQMAQRRGWMDELSAACGLAEVELVEACGTLTRTHWPKGNLVEQCLVENDLFATHFTRVCLAPIPETVPGDLQRQSKLWAGRWKRAFDSEEQREKQMAGFVQSAKLAAPLIPVDELP